VKSDPRLPRDDVNVSRTHPLSEAGTLVLGVLLVIAFLTGLAFVAVEIGVRFLPPSWETRMFSGLLDASVDLDPERTARAQAVVERLAGHWDENPYTFRVGILDSSDPNAFAAPGGTIFVSSGLLAGLSSENELAFVLGHEIGHYRGRDHLRSLGRGLVLELVLSLVLGDGLVGSLGDSVNAFTQLRFSREQERDADRFGLGLVHAEYGHVAGADGFFQRLPDADAEWDEHIGAYFRTHPVTEERIEALDAYARDEGFARTGSLVTFGAGATD